MMNNKLGKMNGYCICFGLLFFVLFQPCISWAYEKEIRELSSALAENISKAGKTRIAVVDFTDLQGNVTELGRFIAEEFAVALLSNGKGFEIVDRTHLQTLIKEHKLSATGLIDPATAQKLGQIAGVDALVTGSITPFGETIRLSVKILDAKTAKLIGANSGNIPATEAIKTLIYTGIQGGGSGGTSAKPISQTPKLQPEQEIEAKGFTFTLQKCERSGDSVTFYFIITNNKEDRVLSLYNNSGRVIDNLGNEYTSQLVQLGQSIARRNYTGIAESNLVSDVPIKASINFDIIEAEAEFIRILEIYLHGDENFKVQFHNIQFSK
jgi:TolB-like protein